MNIKDIKPGSYEIVEENQPLNINNLSKDSYEDVEGETPEVSKTESFLRGAAQGISLGFSDELVAGLKAPFSEKTYSQLRDEERAKYEAAEKANPWTYMAGDVGGSLVLPGGAAKTAATGLAKVGAKEAFKQAAKTGAKLGAVEALGRSEADLTKGQVDQAAWDVLKGAAIGGGTAGVLGAAGNKLAGKADEAGRPLSERVRESALAIPKAEAKKMNLDENFEEKFRRGIQLAKEEGVFNKVDLLKPHTSIEKNYEEVMDRIGKKVGDMFKEADLQFTPKVDELTGRVNNAGDVIRNQFSQRKLQLEKEGFSFEFGQVNNDIGQLRASIKKDGKTIGNFIFEKVDDKGAAIKSYTPPEEIKWRMSDARVAEGNKGKDLASVMWVEAENVLGEKLGAHSNRSMAGEKLTRRFLPDATPALEGEAKGMKYIVPKVEKADIRDIVLRDTFKPENVLKRMEESGKYYDKGDRELVNKIVSNFVEDFRKLSKSENFFQDLHGLKKGVYGKLKSADFIATGPKAGTEADVYRLIGKELRQVEEDLTTKFVDKPQFQETMKRYSDLASLENVIQEGVNREISNKFLGLTDNIVGSSGVGVVGGAVAGGAPGAIVGAVLPITIKKTFESPKMRLLFADFLEYGSKASMIPLVKATGMKATELLKLRTDIYKKLGTTPTEMKQVAARQFMQNFLTEEE